MHRRFWLVGPLAGMLALCLGVFTTALPAAAATPGKLGGMSVADYCADLGYNGNGDSNTALLKGGITGTNFAYGNWACVDIAGHNIRVANSGAAPSMTDLCKVQYPGIASYAHPTDPNDAYTWNCYSLPPASGPGVGPETRAAVNALMSTDEIQAEIAALEAIGPHRLQVELQLDRFLIQRSTQELVTDVLGGYGGRPNQLVVSVELHNAMLKVALHQP